MKFNTKILSIALMSAVSLVIAQNNPHTIISSLENIITDAVVAPQAHKCVCGPMEHWFFKSCVNAYIAQFPGCGLLENNDSEGLSENILQAMAMFVNDIKFVDKDGMPIIPELNAKGKLSLSMSKNPYFKLCKEILSHVEMTTTLTAEELYQQWTEALESMKSAQ